MKMKKIVDNDKRIRHDEDDDVGDPANSSVATNDNDKDAHQHLHSRSTVKLDIKFVKF
uniref:Uncharacterized protein n=2 Tax=Oryza sativa subsp. japonica TaxID=39947 RepID=Q53MD5_ORYSJ|nr:hypothetical protein LOC_Os11g12550 [Oryza sativa Japonica Group]ABA92186.1 hypothetical protein LOC_Os11g12550 [Oryza sativa Japonica Group]